MTDYHTAEACNATSRVLSRWETLARTKHYEEDKSQQGATLILSDERFSQVQLRDFGLSSASSLSPCFFFPGTLENYARSLWTDYRQLKVWQHLKLSPHVANDSPSTDITFNASAAVISIRRTGWDKENPEEREKGGAGRREWACLWRLIIMLRLVTRATISPAPLLLLNNTRKDAITI